VFIRETNDYPNLAWLDLDYLGVVIKVAVERRWHWRYLPGYNLTEITS
jgi:hypothetical protein